MTDSTNETDPGDEIPDGLTIYHTPVRFDFELIRMVKTFAPAVGMTVVFEDDSEMRVALPPGAADELGRMLIEEAGKILPN
jgi:hypothetical protein